MGLRAYVRKSLPPWYYERQQLSQSQDAFRHAGVAFIHVPRTAGLSVARAVYHQDLWCHFTVSALEKNSLPEVRRLPRFAIVRNPWDRAVSAYHFAKQGGVPGGAEMFHPERYRGADFDTFESFVHQYLSVRSPWQLDGVFRPQSHYLGQRGRDRVDHVGFFEHLSDTEEWLSTTLNRPIALKHSNKVDREHYRSCYSEETKEIVAQVYSMDIKRFDYTF